MSVVNVGTEYNTGDTDVTDHDISLPASLVTGNTILVIMTLDGQGGGTSTDLTEILDVPHSTASTQIWAGYRTITGTEGSTVRVTTAGEHAVGWAIQLEDVDDSTFSFTSAEGAASTNYDPPNHTPSGGAIERLWFAIAGVNGGITPPFSQWALPDTQYSGETGGSGAAGGGWSTDVLSDASVNPQTFIGDASQTWVTATMSVETQAASAPVPSRVMPKPARWAVNPGMVAPSWRWAWNKLAFAYVPGVSGDFTNIAANQLGGVVNSGTAGGISIITGRYGAGLQKVKAGTAYDDRVEWADHPTMHLPQDKITVVVLFEWQTSNADSYGTFCGKAHTSEAQPYMSYGLGYALGDLDFSWNNSGTISGLTDTAWDTKATVGTTYLAAGRKGDLWPSGQNHHLDVWDLDNNTKVTDISQGVTDGTIGYSSLGMRIFSSDFVSNTVPGVVYAAYVWGDELSDAQLEQLVRDPFGPIRPAGTLIVPLVEQGTLHSGAGVANSSLQMVGAGTLTLILLYATADGTINSVVNEVDTTVNLYASVDDSPSSPTDTDWINNTAGTGSVFLDLTNMPSDFGTMDTLKLTVRWRGQTYIGNKSIYAQIFQSNETTSMSDEVLVATATGDSSFANTTQVTFTGLDTSSGKAVWDAARIRLRWA